MRYAAPLLSLLLSLLLSIPAIAAHHASGHSHKPASKASGPKGMVIIKSQHDVKTTGDRLEKILKEKGMTVFTRINHSAGAKKVDKVLRPTELVIFGNPKAGTPLMQCAQSVAIDLPQKMLIWQDTDGATWLGYNHPGYLVKRHGINGCEPVIKKITGALKKFATAAAQK